MNLYIIRHGITDWNIIGRWQGRTDIALNNEGIKQATALSARMKNLDITKIYTSPLMRAKTTAEIINNHHNAEIMPIDDLMEIRLAHWEGMSTEEIIKSHQQDFNDWEACIKTDSNFNIENYAELTKRAVDCVINIANNHQDGENLVLVSHGAWIRAFICFVMKIAIPDRMSFVVENTSITTMHYNKNYSRFTVITLNDFLHI